MRYVYWVDCFHRRKIKNNPPKEWKIFPKNTLFFSSPDLPVRERTFGV